MTMTVKETEQQRLREVAHEYQERGYHVVVEPDAFNRPEFLAGYRPDLIARNGSDNVVVEVKSFPSLVEADDLSHLAQTVQEHETWRLELVVPSVSGTPNGAGSVAENRSNLSERLAQIRQLLSQGYSRAAMLMTLSAVEAVVLLFGANQGSAAKRQNTSATATDLLKHDLISRPEYRILLKGLALRNAIAHGEQPLSLEADTVSALITIAERLLNK